MTTTKKPLPPNELVTAPVRLSFPSLDKPRKAGEDASRETYQLTALLPPDYDLAPIKRAIRLACREAFGDDFVLPARKNPIKDCAEKTELDGYKKGWHFMRCSSGTAPGLVDGSLEPVEPAAAKALFFPGCWVRLHLRAYCWNHKTGGKGVTMSLCSVQFVRKDKRLGASTKPADEVFEPIDTDEDDDFTPAKSKKRASRDDDDDGDDMLD